MPPRPPATATLLAACPDAQGLVARLSCFIYEHGGNIVHADHHTDAEVGLFLTRLEWELDGFAVARDAIADAFAPLGRSIGARWELRLSDAVRRMAIFVTRQDHCLLDLSLAHPRGRAERRGGARNQQSRYPAAARGAGRGSLPPRPGHGRDQESISKPAARPDACVVMPQNT